MAKIIPALKKIFKEQLIPRVISGVSMPSYDELKRDYDLSIYHELGHVFVNHMLRTNVRISKVSSLYDFTMSGKARCVVRRGSTRMMSDDAKEANAKAIIVSLMAGSAAEKFFMGKYHVPDCITSDKELAIRYINAFFDDVPDEKIPEILQKAEDEAYEIISQNREKFDALVQALKKKRRMNQGDIEQVLGEPQRLPPKLEITFD